MLITMKLTTIIADDEPLAREGLRVIAVPQPRYPPDSDALARASLVLPGLADLTPGAVEALAAS